MSEHSSLPKTSTDKRRGKRRVLSARFRPRRPLRKVLGKLPADDSLAAMSWMIRALGQLALEVDRDENLKPVARRAEMIRIAVAMARLRDPDRIYRAEQTLRNYGKHIADTNPGPALMEADPNPVGADGKPIATRRGKPPRTGLR